MWYCLSSNRYVFKRVKLSNHFPKALGILYLLIVFPFDHNYYAIFKVCYKGPLLSSFSGTADLSDISLW